MTPVRSLNRLDNICREYSASLYVRDDESVPPVAALTVEDLRRRPFGGIMELIGSRRLLEGGNVKT